MTWDSFNTMPDRLIMHIPDLDPYDAEFLATQARMVARRLAPKMSGRSSRNLEGVWGFGFFGLRWADPYLWFQEAGIRPFTMRNLAGKTIPMWVDDPDGKEQEKNPKAETRVTEDGRTQVLIFRKAAPIGSRKEVVREGQVVDVPRSYPGAPGRISVRELPKPWTKPGKVGGRIARHNVGVRWRHPGLSRRSFIRSSLVYVCDYHGFPQGQIRDQFGRFR